MSLTLHNEHLMTNKTNAGPLCLMCYCLLLSVNMNTCVLCELPIDKGRQCLGPRATEVPQNAA